MNPDYSFIKEYRKKAGLTQKQLADEVGVSSAYIQQIEKGIKKNPSLKLLYDIASILNISPDKMFKDDLTAIYTMAADNIINGVLFKDIDFSNTYYIGSLNDNDNISGTLVKLMKDLIKTVMYCENIQTESITNSTVDELLGIVFEVLTRKDKIHNLEGNLWGSFEKKNK